MSVVHKQSFLVGSNVKSSTIWEGPKLVKDIFFWWFNQLFCSIRDNFLNIPLEEEKVQNFMHAILKLVSLYKKVVWLWWHYIYDSENKENNLLYVSENTH